MVQKHDALKETKFFTDSSQLGKEISNGNPLVSYKFGADPYALVHEDRVYLYMTADQLEFRENGELGDNSYSSINKLSVISSDDLVNWTDHGFIHAAGLEGAAKWATQSWAPAIASKKINGKDQFFLYFANNASGIGVLTSDTPIGPWKDPIGKPLIGREDPEAEGVTWLFDPAVLVDDDGKGYLYYGGGVPEGQDSQPNTARVIQLADDMIHTIGESVVIPAPFMFENAGINKFKDSYYYTYCSNFYKGNRPEGSPSAGEITYMMAENPMGPWEYKGSILRNPEKFFGVGGNNHHAMFEWNDKIYIAYHAQTLAKTLGISNGYRSTHLNDVYVNDDGTIQAIQADYKGVEQVKALNPYEKILGSTIGWQKGVNTEPKSLDKNASDQSIPRVLTSIHSGDWVGLSQVDFETDRVRSLQASIQASGQACSIDIRLGNPEGEIIGTLSIDQQSDETYRIVETEIKKISGIHDVFFVFHGEKSETTLCKVEYWQFHS